MSIQLTLSQESRRRFTNGWRNKIKKGEGKKKKEEKRETVEDIGTNTVSCWEWNAESLEQLGTQPSFHIDRYTVQPGRVYIIAPKSLSIHARACLPVPQLRPQACHNVRHDSEAIRGNHIPSSGAIRGKHRSIRSHQRQSKAVIGPLEAIRRHQR